MFLRCWRGGWVLRLVSSMFGGGGLLCFWVGEKGVVWGFEGLVVMFEVLRRCYDGKRT